MAENREPEANAVMSRDMGSTNTIVVDSGDNEKTHEFNDQTNYVPKRAIITVRFKKQWHCHANRLYRYFSHVPVWTCWL
jgi:hypothetical protein